MLLLYLVYGFLNVAVVGRLGSDSSCDDTERWRWWPACVPWSKQAQSAAFTSTAQEPSRGRKK